jgi:serine/threonine protein kinase
MSNDDESKKDDQGSAGSASNQDAEQKQPVYLFPEHSVYDLEPIVVPDNMRLAPDSEETSTADAEAEQIEKVKASAEQTKVARDKILKSRIDTARAAQNRAEKPAPPPLPPVQDKKNGSETKSDTPTEEWTEHASAVLEHFGWERSGWVNPEKLKEPESAQPVDEVGKDVPPAAGNGANSLDAASAQIAEPAETDKQDDSQKEPSRSLFPENSMYELDPIVVVPDDQKLSPTRRPTFDPKRNSQKLSPIKIDKLKAGAQRQAAEERQAALKAEGKLEATVAPSAATPATQISAAAAPATPGQAEETTQAEQTTPIAAEPDSIHVVEQGPGETSAVPADQVIAQPASLNTLSEPEEIRSHETATDADPKAEGGWEEPTGWEEVREKQDKWSEQTGWEEASGEQVWEKNGWADVSGEQQAHADLPPAENLHSDENSQVDTAAGAISPNQDEHTVTVSEGGQLEQTTSSAPSFVPKTVQNLFGSDDEDDEEFPASIAGASAEEPAPVEPEQPHGTIASAATETIADGQVTGEQPVHADASVTTGEQPVQGNSGWVTGEQAVQPDGGDVTGEHAVESTGSTTGETDIQVDDSPQIQIIPWGASAQETTPIGQSAPTPDSAPGAESEAAEPFSSAGSSEKEPFSVSNLGIETADIDQIILEHNSINMSLRQSGPEQAEYEERVMRELIEKEQRGEAAAGEQQELDQPEDSQPKTEDEYQYDEEDVLQEFRPTDSIYELAPFVLPAGAERLTEDDQNQTPAQPAAKAPPTVKQIVRTSEMPERPAVPSYSTDPLVGTTLAHSYEVLDVIGQGGMAIVYRAKQIATGRLVALKTLRSPNPQDLMRFSQEIKTHSGLNHKNIVGFIDSFVARDQVFLVMERVRGISLQEIIRALGKLDEPENIVDILSQILDALEYAHAGGLIHRDLKTGNIILIKEVDNDMVVKILDFGIAKVQGDMQRLTHVGQALGSPIYMSPEQCSGKTLSTRSDLYSLGVVLYESVTGTPPYSKGTLINVMAAHCNENIKPKPLSEMAPNLPRYKLLDQILQKALQTHPDKRWQSAAEFKLALQFWLKCVQNELAYDDLPVELLRCPVTEYDMEKLLASAKSSSNASATPVVAVKDPVPFQWAQEPSPASEKETWGEETEAWNAEQQAVVPGWGEGTQPQSDAAPGWGQEGDSPKEAPGVQPWGGSERHRQGQTGDTWSSKDAPLTSAPDATTPSPSAEAPGQAPSQAETSDLWSAQQKMQQERRPPVRDLLASPASPPTGNFEVQTSVDTPSLGSQLPKLTVDEKQEIRSIANTGSLQRSLNDPDDTRTTDDAEAVAPAAPIDLRRRQTTTEPAANTPQWVSIALVVVVSVVLTFCLSAWYFVSNPEDVKAKWELLQGLSNKSSVENKKTNDQSSSRNSPADGSTEKNSSSDSGPASDKSDSSSPSTKAEDKEATSKSTSNSADGQSTGAPTKDTEKPTDSGSDSTSTETGSEETPKQGEPIPFKKAEPEEGVDF